MKILPFALVISSLFLLCLYGCNSKGYEIEEEAYIDTIPAYSSKAEIKQEIENQKGELKQEVRNGSVKKKEIIFSVQIGAFENESNAADFTARAKEVLDFHINFYFIDGLYKVRLDDFKDKDEAISILNKVITSGYSNAFIIETSE